MRKCNIAQLKIIHMNKVKRIRNFFYFYTTTAISFETEYSFIEHHRCMGRGRGQIPVYRYNNILSIFHIIIIVFGNILMLLNSNR